ncbi:MAG: S9 family peptidase, partial [Bacteroidales bacterium]|nr:S9 family peptidase [Bacteroidales bacterium]
KYGTELKNIVAYRRSDTLAKNLYVLNLKTMAQDTVVAVDSYNFDRAGNRIAYISKYDRRTDGSFTGVGVYDIAKKTNTVVTTLPNKAYVTNVAFDRTDKFLSYFANNDTTSDASRHPDLYVYDGVTNRMLVSSDHRDIPDGWQINIREAMELSYDGTRAYFGIYPKPHVNDTTIPAFEKAKFDLWTWNEDYLQSVQKIRVNTDRNRSYTAAINLDGTGKIVQFEDPDFTNVPIGEFNGYDYVITTTDKPYRVQSQWNAEAISDVYKVSLKDGSRQLLKEASPVRFSGTSPDGRYYIYYHTIDLNYYIYDITTGVHRNLTAPLEGRIFYNDEDDRPTRPSATGRPTWSVDSKTFYIADKYDVWKFTADGSVAPVMVTEGLGSANNVTYSIMNLWSRNGKNSTLAACIPTDKPLYFLTFNHTTKKYGYATKDITRKNAKLTALAEGPYTYQTPAISVDPKGKKNIFAYTKGNYEVGSNVWMSDDNFKTEKQISDINPQQRDYNWGTVELVSWTARTGKQAEGLLFKPENFDPNKKYPVMIYFYERYSDELYAVRTPAPSRSTVNIPFFVSNEYIVFVPDIYYEIGHPGKSALDFILPGCDMLCQYPWIDGDNMAIQGQSWGGYQVAYMITQTNRFKAAGAGAPVSNMTSAYGGIRWGSGVTRQFQYEQQQSRIGKDLWSGLDLYLENSPLFYVPNVTTPVLITHNDADDAVPWWQGIEFFTALRRCGKVAWMLQYNDETHNLSQRRNAKDLSVRLSEFFDHYLKGAPMPDWMKYGIPAVDKEQ